MKKIILSLSALLLLSCSSDYLETNLDSKITDDKLAKLAEESPEALLSLAETFDVASVNGIRTSGISGDEGHNDYGQKSIDMMMDLMSNDMIDANAGWWYNRIYDYTVRTQEQRANAVIWGFYYTIIKSTNLNIFTITSGPSSALTPELKYVLARSRALRGFCYFQLIQIYQKGNPALTDPGVPLIDPKADVVNGRFPRLTVGDVYDQISKDYKFAYENINGYERSNKSQLNKNVIAGLLARYALLKKDYPAAVNYAKEARSAVTLDTELSHGFQLVSNPSWIWGAEIDEKTTSYYASFFAQMQSYSPTKGAKTPGYPGQVGHHRTCDKSLFDMIPVSDVRKKWFGLAKDDLPLPVGADQIYQYKFYDDTFFQGDYLYMRAAEMYLIEAEALAESGDSSGAAQVLFDLVSTRDSGYVKSSNIGDNLISEIHNQRRIELWGEGFGLLDMKRWGVALERNYPGSTHVEKSSFPVGDDAFTLQIPESEININDAINKEDQNP